MKGCLLIVLGLPAVIIVVLVVSALNRDNASPSTGSAPVSSAQKLEQERAAILAYKICEKGHTVETATAMALRTAQAQSVSPIRYVDHDSRMSKYSVPYKARNGTEKMVAFNYTPSTGKVNAENDDGLAVLNLMQASCR